MAELLVGRFGRATVGVRDHFLLSADLTDFWPCWEIMQDLKVIQNMVKYARTVSMLQI